MNKSSATKKFTFFLIVLLLSFLSFSCGDGNGNSMGGGNQSVTSDTDEARLAKALAGLSYVNEANAKCTLDFTADGKVIVNKGAPYSDPKEFVKEFWEYGKITVDKFSLNSGSDGRWALIIDSEEQDETEVIDVDDINDITLLEDYYGYKEPHLSGINDPILYSLTAEENLEFEDVDVSDDGKTYSGKMLLPMFEFYTPSRYYKIKYKGKEYETSRLNTDYDHQLECFEIDICRCDFEFNTETKQLYVAHYTRDELNERLEKWSAGNNYYKFDEGYGYPCDFFRTNFSSRFSPPFDIKDGSPAYYRLASSPSGGSGEGNEGGGAITLSGEYSVIGSSANVTLSFSNGTMTKKAGSGTGTATSYAYKINGKKLTITQSSGGNDITNDFTLSESGGNIVVSGEQAFVFMIFGVNAETATLTRN